MPDVLPYAQPPKQSATWIIVVAAVIGALMLMGMGLFGVRVVVSPASPPATVATPSTTQSSNSAVAP